MIMFRLNFKQAFFAYLIEFWLVNGTFGRTMYIPGSVTETAVTHFEFVQRLGNPCGIVKLENPSNQDHSESQYSSSYSYNEEYENHTQFYQSMIMTIDRAQEKLRLLLNADPDLPECRGAKLDTLPTTPSLSEMNVDQLIRESYKSGIFLAAHLHIMGLDRQLTFVGVNDVGDENIDEHNGLPSWRYLRCGNESDTFMLRLAEMTLQMEGILCTLVSSANLIQRASFRDPFNQLTRTTFYRYHSSCSTLQTRDCLVISETKNALRAMSTKFNLLLNNSDRFGSVGSNTYQDLNYNHV